MGAEPGAVRRRAAALALIGIAGAFILALQACFRAPEMAPAAAATRLSSPAALDRFFAALDGLDAHRTAASVRILQLGDSHTASDALSGRLRERLQARFGSAGRGWLPAGIPFKYYRPQLVGVGENGWQHYRPADHAAGVPFGLDAIDAQSRSPESMMAIDSTEQAGFDRFAVEYLARPNGTPFTVAIDGGAPIRVATASATGAIRAFDLLLDRPAHHAELRTAGRPPVDLLGWAVERRGPGIIYENHGTIGATVELLGHLTPAAVSFELTERRPALVIVAFGTNEGFDDTLDISRYATDFRTLVAELQRRAPDASILVLGPPDGNRVGHGCAPAGCAAGDAAAADCAWHEPPMLAAVRDGQRRIAAAAGWAYWDWYGAMGGQCSIDRLYARRMAAPDHVHLTRPGYDAVADLLFGDLIAAYDSWRRRGPTS